MGHTKFMQAQFASEVKRSGLVFIRYQQGKQLCLEHQIFHYCTKPPPPAKNHSHTQLPPPPFRSRCQLLFDSECSIFSTPLRSVENMSSDWLKQGFSGLTKTVYYPEILFSTPKVFIALKIHFQPIRVQEKFISNMASKTKNFPICGSFLLNLSGKYTQSGLNFWGY